MVKNEKVSIIVDLIARALGVDYTNRTHVATLTGYLDLYADAVNEQRMANLKRLGRQAKTGILFEPLLVPDDMAEEGIEVEEVKLEPQDTLSPEEPVPLPEADEPAPANEAPARSVFSGAGGSEKRVIYEKLKAFREANGLGCLSKLQEKANGAIMTDEIRSMLSAGNYPIAKWRVLDAAIDAMA